MKMVIYKDESDDNVKTTIGIDEDGNITAETEGDVNVTAKNITAMCSSFVIKKDKNSSAVFEVTP